VSLFPQYHHRLDQWITGRRQLSNSIHTGILNPFSSRWIYFPSNCKYGKPDWKIICVGLQRRLVVSSVFECMGLTGIESLPNGRIGSLSTILRSGGNWKPSSLPSFLQCNIPTILLSLDIGRVTTSLAVRTKK